MWCSTCQQDVPAAPDSRGENLDCPRCGETINNRLTPDELLRVAEVSDHGLELETIQFGEPGPPLRWDNWELDDTLRRADWMTRDQANPSAAEERPAGAWLEPFHRAAQAAAENNTSEFSRLVRGSSHSGPPEQDGGGTGLSFLAMSLGLVSFACGAALLVWSLVEERPELWDFGLPAALAGQFLLLVGIILRMERLSGGRQGGSTSKNGAHGAIMLPPHTTLWSGDAHPFRFSAELRPQVDQP